MLSDQVERGGSFDHFALLYASDEQYLAQTVEFIEEGLDSGEPVLVAVPRAKLRLLEPRFEGSASDSLRFVAMEEMGRNPAWIIPAWSDFARPHARAGRAARGIGEPVWSARSPDELVECGRHEALINVAFADVAGFSLLCPYDVSTLGDEVVAEAHRNHPCISRSGETTISDSYDAGVPPWLETPLSPVPPEAQAFSFTEGSMRPVREAVAQFATSLGLSRSRVGDLEVAVSEAMSNSVCHGGGSGVVLLWGEPGHVRCEIRDAGHIADPLAGRVRPGLKAVGGRGLWIMTQLCDLVQIRVHPCGQTIRLHLSGDAVCATA